MEQGLRRQEDERKCTSRLETRNQNRIVMTMETSYSVDERLPGDSQDRRGSLEK